MISQFTDRQAVNEELFELEDVETGEKKQYRIVSKATVTKEGTPLNKATLDPILNEINSKLSVNGGTLDGNVTPRVAGFHSIGADTMPFSLMRASTGKFNSVLAPGVGMGNVGGPGVPFANVYATNGTFNSSLKVGSYDVWHKGNLKVAYGSVQMDSNQATKKQVIDLAGYGFTEVPMVFVNPLTGNPTNIFISATRPSTTQFEINLTCGNGHAGWVGAVSWLAVGK